MPFLIRSDGIRCSQHNHKYQATKRNLVYFLQEQINHFLKILLTRRLGYSHPHIYMIGKMFIHSYLKLI